MAQKRPVVASPAAAAAAAAAVMARLSMTLRGLGLGDGGGDADQESAACSQSVSQSVGGLSGRQSGRSFHCHGRRKPNQLDSYFARRRRRVESIRVDSDT